MKKQKQELPDEAMIIRKSKTKKETFAYTLLFGLIVGLVSLVLAYDEFYYDRDARNYFAATFFVIGVFSYYFFTTKYISFVYRIIIILVVDFLIFVALAFVGLMLGVYSLM